MSRLPLRVVSIFRMDYRQHLRVEAGPGLCLWLGYLPGAPTKRSRHALTTSGGWNWQVGSAAVMSPVRANVRDLEPPQITLNGQ